MRQDERQAVKKPRLHALKDLDMCLQTAAYSCLIARSDEAFRQAKKALSGAAIDLTLLVDTAVEERILKLEAEERKLGLRRWQNVQNHVADQIRITGALTLKINELKEFIEEMKAEALVEDRKRANQHYRTLLHKLLETTVAIEQQLGNIEQTIEITIAELKRPANSTSSNESARATIPDAPIRAFDRQPFEIGESTDDDRDDPDANKETLGNEDNTDYAEYYDTYEED
jgi:hypothetical protein